jgi:hypothetical protein
VQGDPFIIDQFKKTFLSILCQKPVPTLFHNCPAAISRISADRAVFIFKNPFPGSEKNRLFKNFDLPYICKSAVLLGYQVLERSVL